MTQICPPEQCTGCMACLNICPVQAISQGKNKKGFYVPRIDAEKCIDCGRCADICPTLSYPSPNTQQGIYACWSKDEKLRYNSTSGGLFSLLSEQVIQAGGIVFGVSMDADMCAEHCSARDEESLARMRGSKYVQSRVGTIYRQVKAVVQTGQPVLFSGTPCQVAGLRNYLGRSYDNLLLIDILCHGVPSPEVFSAYLSYIRDKTGQTDIASVSFRNKFHSWNLFRMQIQFASGTKYCESTLKDPFLRAFLRDYCLNEACYACRFIGTNRQGDITLADFWGYLSEQHSLRNDDKGISLVMVNSEKGKHWMERLDVLKTEIIPKSLQEAILGNHTLSQSTKKPLEADAFWACFLRNHNFEDCTHLLQPEKESIKHKCKLWVDAHFYLLPSPMQAQYRKVLERRVEKGNAHQ